jgi:integrase
MGTLTVAKIRALTRPGRYGDGDGLWLQVRSTDRRSWLFRYMLRGKARAMGLGPVDLISLADARTAAREYRQLLLRGTDPLEHRRRIARVAPGEGGPTFSEVAELYIAAHEAGWKNAKHRYQWRNTLSVIAAPVFGDKPIVMVNVGDVMMALEPIWHSKAETASRTRGRIESVLDYAAARGWRQGDNPARWRGHLANLLPARRKFAAIRHFAALPWRDMATFMVELRQREGSGARALEFAILTAARSGEVRGMHWGEIDLGERCWNVPAARMKARREHRVPLSEAAYTVLSAVAPPAADPDAAALVFASTKPGKPLSDMSLTAVLRRMGRSDLTVHGFRSSFRDWLSEATTYPGELAEAALAHVISNKVEAAYRRGDLFEKRRQMMDAWAEHCARPIAPAEVVRLHRQRAQQ